MTHKYNCVNHYNMFVMLHNFFIITDDEKCEWTHFFSFKFLLLRESRGEASSGGEGINSPLVGTGIRDRKPCPAPAKPAQTASRAFWSRATKKDHLTQSHTRDPKRDVSPQQSETASALMLLCTVETEEKGHRQDPRSNQVNA